MLTAAEFDTSVNRRLLKNGTPMPLAFATLGLVGEAAETFEILVTNRWLCQPDASSDLRNEVGDVLWYVAACARAMGTTFERVALGAARDGGRYLEMPTGRTKALVLVAGLFADKVKKSLWHGKQYANGELEVDLQRVYVACGRVMEEYLGETVHHAMQANHEKLLKRHPMKPGFYFVTDTSEKHPQRTVVEVYGDCLHPEQWVSFSGSDVDDRLPRALRCLQDWDGPLTDPRGPSTPEQK